MLLCRFSIVVIGFFLSYMYFYIFLTSAARSPADQKGLSACEVSGKPKCGAGGMPPFRDNRSPIPRRKQGGTAPCRRGMP